MIEVMFWVNAFSHLVLGTIWSRKNVLNLCLKVGILSLAALNFYVIFKVLP